MGPLAVYLTDADRASETSFWAQASRGATADVFRWHAGLDRAGIIHTRRLLSAIAVGGYCCRAGNGGSRSDRVARSPILAAAAAYGNSRGILANRPRWLVGEEATTGNAAQPRDQK